MDIDQSATFYNVSLTSKEFPGLATEMKYTAYIIACTSITCRQSDGVGICKCVPSVLPILFPFLCLISRPLHNSSSFLCSLLFPLSFLFAFSICISSHFSSLFASTTDCYYFQPYYILSGFSLHSYLIVSTTSLSSRHIKHPVSHSHL